MMQLVTLRRGGYMFYAMICHAPLMRAAAEALLFASYIMSLTYAHMPMPCLSMLFAAADTLCHGC